MTNDQSPMNGASVELKDANSVVILLPKNPSFEHVASGLALYLSLERAGKSVEIVSPSEMLVEVNRLVGVQRVKTKLSGRNLVISFNYVKDAIEKVSYNVDDGKFNLVVVPKNGHAPLDHNSVSYSYSGMSGDVIILVGTKDMNDAKEVLSSGENLNNCIALIASQDRTLASETALLLASLNIIPDVDIANNLFAGLVKETKNFQDASAIDFETAAALVRAGARIQSGDLVVESKTQKPNEPVNPEWLKQPKIFRAGEGT